MLPTYAFTVEEMVARHDWALTFAHPPDVDSLFHTNNMPTPAQVVQLKASLDSLEAPLAEVQSYLNLLRGAVASLETQMSRLQSLRHEYTTALSPIRRIPSEILAKILCSWENSRAAKGSSKFNVFVMREGPWRLGQVCSSWRSVVETLCPELWATLLIEDRGALSPSLKNKHIEILRRVLERSRNHPLHFTFDRPSADSDPSLQVMEQCFNIMIAHSARWETAEIIVPPLFIPRLDLIRGKIDWLKKVDLVCSDNSGLESKSIHAFEIAPSLQVLHLRDMHPEANILFPTVNLISLSDHRPWSGDRLDPEYLGVIKSAPNLRSFSYIDYDAVRPISTSHTLERAINPSIEKLSTCSQDFMRGVILRSLKEVALVAPLNTVTWGYPVNALYGLNEMLIHSQCSLTRLSLDDIALDENLPVILRLSPQLEEFYIDLRQEWMDEYDPVMRDLVTQMKETIMVEGSPQHCLVPSLQRFTIRLLHVCSVVLSFLDLDFVEMIESRVHGPHVAPRPTKLYLLVLGYMWTSCLDEDDVLALKRLKDKDLDVFVVLRGADP
ncbi:hypothetical protein ARMGADRAFT_271065 [Armillaria gallica]|uniref:Uncharacterized protein n=1 Tax=Armillaria gallica TaxID=47427 RepID=A0A2H3ET65_ARMGA|nr:hypothetical protein ARMGADRAFT_271065 [Armillaria gallica]